MTDRISTLENTCPDCGRFTDEDVFISSNIKDHCCPEGIVRSAREEGVQITSCQHEDAPGTHTVHYRTRAGLTFLSVTYPSKREASIQSLMVMFPGSSRSWLERMHR